MAILLNLVERIRRLVINAGRRRAGHFLPRRWSNRELKRCAKAFDGDVVNVSGWQDRDKEGSFYRDYFANARSYSITNYKGSTEMSDGSENSIYLDLEADLPSDLERRFDVVYCHTILEHIFNVQRAMENICRLSKDIVIQVVPFMQEEHYSKSIFGDYWRFTPLGIKKLFEEQGLELVYLSSNDNPWYPTYLFAVGSRNPEKWKSLFAGEYNWESRLARMTYHYPGNHFW